MQGSPGSGLGRDQGMVEDARGAVRRQGYGGVHGVHMPWTLGDSGKAVALGYELRW
ncbi:MAG: hypothetical protein M3044_18185 [Thermoproteota archaeon]|nr:hypothetical protein [Thermoproteota archaeon]